MIPLREVIYSVFGAWRLATLDRGGLQHFNATVEGFWRSFFAAAILLPAHVLLIALHDPPGAGPTPAAGAVGDGEADWFRFLAVKGIAYVVGWTAWPLVMFHVAKAIGRETSYLRYIVAYNWAQVIGTGLFVLVAILAMGLLPTPAVENAFLVTTLILLVYQWFIARVGLEISGWLAAGMVTLDLIVTILIANVALNLGGGL